MADYLDIMGRPLEVGDKVDLWNWDSESPEGTIVKLDESGYLHVETDTGMEYPWPKDVAYIRG